MTRYEWNMYQKQKEYKLSDYSDMCGACVHYERIYKDGKIQEHGRCAIKGNYHNSSQKKCKKHFERLVEDV